MTGMPDRIATAIFLITIVATFIASYLGQRHGDRRRGSGLSDQKLDKWLIGLSAGATANSGFVVTGAVGLGYAYGVRWLLLPLAWLLGDILFWTVFPQRINRAARETRATTMTDVMTEGLDKSAARSLKVIVGLISLLCLGGYISAQWIAGEKFLAGAFGFGGPTSLTCFATLIVVYTAIGSFRGSVYADSLQAVIRVGGTAVALLAIVWVASSRSGEFRTAIQAAGPDFLSLAPSGVPAAAAFMLGYAAAALGFGLGQPQMVSRYMAGRSPEETRAAWWVYIGFVQFTWLAMTAFGIILRGVMPDLADPETGLSVFFRSQMGPIPTGLIVADIFATIAATSNSLLVAMAQTVRHDLLLRPGDMDGRQDLWPISAALGIATMLVASQSSASVVDLALSSVALMGAGFAPVLMTRLLAWPRSGAGAVGSIVAGITVASLWKFFGYGAIMNEACPGILAGLTVSGVTAILQRTSLRRPREHSS